MKVSLEELMWLAKAAGFRKAALEWQVFNVDEATYVEHSPGERWAPHEKGNHDQAWAVMQGLRERYRVKMHLALSDVFCIFRTGSQLSEVKPYREYRGAHDWDIDKAIVIAALKVRAAEMDDDATAPLDNPFEIGDKVRVLAGDDPFESTITDILPAGEQPPDGWVHKYFNMEADAHGYAAVNKPAKADRIVVYKRERWYIVIPWNRKCQHNLEKVEVSDGQEEKESQEGEEAPPQEA